MKVRAFSERDDGGKGRRREASSPRQLELVRLISLRAVELTKQP